jgi:hypothetical protein
MFTNTVGSQQSVVPKGLPLLPGNGFKDPTLQDFRKSHVFDVHQGIPVAHAPGAGAPPPTSEVEPPKMPAMPTADITPVQPAWVAFDRKVLRFNCFFKEAVNESRLENFRIRNCVLYYYLEDDSMHLSEPKVENSGIPQGERKGTVFLKRHRVPKEGGGFYGVADLNVGKQINMYGRVFLITDADNFTRNFLSNLGIEVGETQEVPADPYTMTREDMKMQITRNQKYFHPRCADDDLIRNVEARLGCSSTLLEPDKLDQFLKYDRKVLRFYLAWDDRKSLYGELRPFVLHYYLSDDSMEVLEVRRANAGRDPFPLFLKRGKVYKNLDSYLNIDAPTTHTTQLIDRTGRVDPATMETFTESDFAVGKEVVINGATFLIYGCDEFTRDYYEKVYGVKFDDIPVQFDESIERPQMVIPPHVAPGAEEDSLGSFLYLIPKVPKKNFRRMMENDRKILRFMARLDTDAPEDQGRIFVIKYFMADDTVAAFEPPQKNSGIMGGKFIQRGRVKKPNSHEYYTQADFYTGARIEFNKFGFVLYQADEYSLSYMESDPESHPMSDIHYISEQLRPVLKEKTEALMTAFAAEDPADSGLISYEVLQDCLSANDMELNDQVLITLMRRYDVNKDGTVAYKDLMSI